MASYLSVDDRHPELCVIDKFLGPSDVTEICERLRNQSATKRRLVLKGNCLGSAGASVLADYLRENVSMQHVSLEWNQLGDAGVVSLASALPTCRVVELDLRNNNVQSAGAKALARAIMMNESIKVLDIRWNQLSDADALQFREAILDRVPALEVRLGGNLLSTECTSTLDKWHGKEDFQEEKSGSNSSSGVASTSASNGSSSSSSSSSKREFNGPSTASAELQSSILQKETSVLRSQNTILQGELRDLQRQLDASAVRVTEVEQQFIKEEFRSKNFSEQLKSANMRVAMQMEELKNLTASWEQDRLQNAADTKRLVSDQEVEVRSMCTERDRARDNLRKAEDKAERLAIQLEQLSRHVEQERASTQTELQLAHQSVTELATAEAKIKGENAVLQHSKTRFTERVAQLEAELDAVKEQAAADLATEFRVRGDEMDRLRSEFASQAAVTQEKISRQSRELAELYKKHAELQAETSMQRVEMQEKSDADIAAVRESEARRCESTVHEFRGRLDAYLTSRSEVEGRCEGLMREVRSAREEQVSLNAHFEKQIKEMDGELRRLREEKLLIEATLASAQRVSEASHGEKEASQKRMVDSESRLADTQRCLQECVLERGALRLQVGELQQQVDKLEVQRRVEFAAVTDALTLTLQNELQSLKANFRILDPPLVAASPALVVASPAPETKPSSGKRR